MPVVGKPVPHDSALGHVTGQAPYIDDLRPLAGELSSASSAARWRRGSC